MRLSTLTLLAIPFLSSTFAHPGEDPHDLSDREYHEYSARALKARSCRAQVDEHMMRKRGARGLLTKRGFKESTGAGCIATPEVMEGPYYVSDELVRNDLTEDQPGIPLTIEFSVVDLDTCEPVTNALVEIWSANTTGYYAGYTKEMGPPPGRDGPGPGGPDGRPPPIEDFHPRVKGSSKAHSKPKGQHDHLEGHSGITHHEGKGHHSLSNAKANAAPPGRDRGPGGPGGGRGGPAMDDSSSYCRGGNVVDENGEVSLTTIYPGFYSGRTAHIHVMVHVNYTINPNGTIASHEGSIVHVGQMFFEQSLNDDVFATYPYTANIHKMVPNEKDGLYNQFLKTGYPPHTQVEWIGDLIEDGLMGYSTVVVDLKNRVEIHGPNHATTFTYIPDSTPTESVLLEDAASEPMVTAPPFAIEDQREGLFELVVEEMVAFMP